MATQPPGWQYPPSAPPPYGYPAPPPFLAPPPAVRNAVWLMYAGAALSAFNGVVGAVWGRAFFRSLLTQPPMPTETAATATTVTAGGLVADVLAAAIVAAGLVEAVLWLWMAWKNRRGRNWARVLSTVFFGLRTLGMVNGIVGGGPLGLRILGVVAWITGLFTIILLWRTESGQYYRAVKIRDAYARIPPGYAPWQPYGYPPAR